MNNNNTNIDKLNEQSNFRKKKKKKNGELKKVVRTRRGCVLITSVLCVE